MCVASGKTEAGQKILANNFFRELCCLRLPTYVNEAYEQQRTSRNSLNCNKNNKHSEAQVKRCSARQRGQTVRLACEGGRERTASGRQQKESAAPVNGCTCNHLPIPPIPIPSPPPLLAPSKWDKAQLRSALAVGGWLINVWHVWAITVLQKLEKRYWYKNI